MFCSRRLNSLINNVHEETLGVVYDDHSSPYSELMLAKSEPTIHQHNVKIFIELSLPLISNMFQVRKYTFNVLWKNCKYPKKKKKCSKNGSEDKILLCNPIIESGSRWNEIIFFSINIQRENKDNVYCSTLTVIHCGNCTCRLQNLILILSLYKLYN